MKNKKYLSPEEALSRLMAKCARSEVCIYDARRAMINWGIALEEQNVIINTLIGEKFIDELRYAEAFVRDKMNFSRWGERKILEALYNKRIPKEIIHVAMDQVIPEKLNSRLETDLLRKNLSIKVNDIYKRKEKLLRFGVSRGFKYETVIEIINKLIDQ